MPSGLKSSQLPVRDPALLVRPVGMSPGAAPLLFPLLKHWLYSRQAARGTVKWRYPNLIYYLGSAH